MTPFVLVGIEASLETYPYQAILGYVLTNPNYTAAVHVTYLETQFEEITSLITNLSGDMNWYFSHILEY
jgi:hypothetical protein